MSKTIICDPTVNLRVDWWKQNIGPDIDLTQPGIYEWQIEGVGVYIGQSKRLRQRIREYPNNVSKLLRGAPYRKSKLTAYRAIHHELKRAYEDLNLVSVTVLENCNISELNERERHWIAVRRFEASQGGPAVLNA